MLKSYENFAFNATNEVFDKCSFSPTTNNGSSHNEMLSIMWRNLSYEVNNYGIPFGPKKSILRSLNGGCEFSSMTALMGPSGAGKTTLLNVLSGNIKSGLTSDSKIYLNNQLITDSEPITSYFVTQYVHESIVAQMTIGEVLRYAYKFKNGLGDRSELIQERIDTILSDLLLPNDIVKRRFENCSGGEQKRIAVAQELMSKKPPSFLFIDEPTTGLDSSAAFEVISSLAKLRATYRCTIIASIHSPNQDTLCLFDQLYVMAKGGVAIYSGSPRRITPFIEKTIQLKTSEHQVPVELLLKIACNGLYDQQVQTLAIETQTQEQLHTEPHMSSMSCLKSGIPTPRAPFKFSNLLLQTERLFRFIYISNFNILIFNLVLFPILFIVLTSFFNLEMVKANPCYSLDMENTNLTCSRNLHQTQMVDQTNIYHSYTSILVGFIVMCICAISYSKTIKFFRNEYRNRWYSLGVYYLSSFITTLIEVSIYSVIMTSLSYYFSNQTAIDNSQINWNRFGHYALIILVLCIYTQSIGQLLGLILADLIEIAIILCQLTYITMILMDGFFVDTEKSEIAFFREMANVIATNRITRSTMYTFFVLDRCDSEGQFSRQSLIFHVDENAFSQYLLRVLVNIVIIRLITLVILFIKYNNIPTIFPRSKTNSTSLIPEKHIEQKNLANSSITNTLFMQNESTQESIKTTQFHENTKDKFIMAWRSVCLFGSSSIFSTGRTTNQKPILNNVSGQLRFGTLNALMGTSGAGKTSLLKVINGRYKTRLSDESEFYLSKHTNIETCFITQEVSGHLMTGLTAKQMLTYACKLKNPSSSVNVDKLVTDILDVLDLTDTANTRLEKCSGGERKRLALAAELTAKNMPNLICIDEPTSGLDSNSAETVISCLARLCRSHHVTIVASIHQPNSTTLFMFDYLYVLARGGMCIYSGPPDGIESRLSHVIANRSSNIESNYPIEELIKYSCLGTNNLTVNLLTDEHERSLKMDQIKLVEDTQLVEDGVQQNRARFSFRSVGILLIRYLVYIRGFLWMHYFALNVFSFILIMLLIQFFGTDIAGPSGCINMEEDFNNTCTRTPEKIIEENLLTENYKYSFFGVTNFIFLVMLQSALIIGMDLVQLHNEHRNGWYSSGAFYTMKFILETLFLPFLIMMYVYFFNIYEDSVPGLYWKFVQIIFLGSVAIQGLAHIYSFISRGNIIIFTVVSVSSFFCFILMSNFFIKLEDLHYVFRFISNFAIQRFVMEPILLLQYGFGRCNSKEIQPILYQMALKDEDYSNRIFMLFVNIIVYRLIALAFLLHSSNSIQNRRKRVSRVSNYQKYLFTIGVDSGFEVHNQAMKIKQIALH